MTLSNQTFDISYARVSTNSINQLTSIGNQISMLKKYNENCKIIVHQGSGQNNMNDELKSIIVENYNKNNIVRLNIIAFDRLTRNYSDIDFIRKYVKYIHVISENRIYDVSSLKDLQSIVEKITESVVEGQMIKQRCIRESLNRNKVVKQKTVRGANCKKRCRETENNIIAYGLTKELIKQLKDFIHLSQNICSREDWSKLFGLLCDFDIDVNEFRKQYFRELNMYKEKEENDMPIFKLQKKVVIKITKEVLYKNQIECDKVILNGFINSYYNQALQYDPIEENTIKNDVENMLVQLKVSTDDLKKLANIIEIVTNKK